VHEIHWILWTIQFLAVQNVHPTNPNSLQKYQQQLLLKNPQPFEKGIII